MAEHRTAGQQQCPTEPAEWVLAPLELRTLISLLRGGWTTPLVRRQLWRAWGLCRRHFWWYAAVDCELYRSPFKTAILCSELVERSTAQLRLSLVRPTRRVLGLRSAAPCVACEETHAQSPQLPPPRPVSRERKRLEGIVGSIAGAPMFGQETGWLEDACPDCVGGTGLVCRVHLLHRSRAPKDPGEVRELAGNLDDLHDRLRVLLTSMRGNGRAAATTVARSWIQALGWLAEWPPPWLHQDEHGSWTLASGVGSWPR